MNFYQTLGLGQTINQTKPRIHTKNPSSILKVSSSIPFCLISSSSLLPLLLLLPFSSLQSPFLVLQNETKLVLNPFFKLRPCLAKSKLFFFFLLLSFSNCILVPPFLSYFYSIFFSNCFESHNFFYLHFIFLKFHIGI